jgi:aminoglycoside phosphotransferase (APT) family kinase protein
MHADEQVATTEQVVGLIAAQHPRWAGLDVVPVAEHGTDHCLFRLGDDLVVRMPRVAGAVGQLEKVASWLPRLAPHLPVAVPTQVALGEPGEGFPWPWSVVPWLPGRTATTYGERDVPLALDLAAFVNALQSLPVDDAPTPPAGARGAPLHHVDDAVRRAVRLCGDRVDAAAVLAVWDDALGAPEHDGPGVWLHGDLMAGNLLLDDAGRLSGVIDFLSLEAGDPAPDLTAYWNLLASVPRAAFREALDHDDATWRRARGWALAPALTGIPYYWDTAPAFAQRGLRTVEVVLADAVDVLPSGP